MYTFFKIFVLRIHHSSHQTQQIQLNVGNSPYAIVASVIAIYNCVQTGMEFDKFKVDGQMDQHISPNARYKLAKVMSTTSLLLAKEELYGGMLIFHG